MDGRKIGRLYRTLLQAGAIKSTIQGLVVEGLTVEDIWKGDVKGVKVNGVRNIGQGHRVKLPAESVH